MDTHSFIATIHDTSDNGALRQEGLAFLGSVPRETIHSVRFDCKRPYDINDAQNVIS